VWGIAVTSRPPSNGTAPSSTSCTLNRDSPCSRARGCPATPAPAPVPTYR
jgi:hypothetical protein